MPLLLVVDDSMNCGYNGVGNMQDAKEHYPHDKGYKKGTRLSIIFY